ncbi:MAG: sulfatase/phosphatase domain-containing protein [Cyclobacteriaceae bacterium]
MPTMLEAADISIPELLDLDGVSYLPLLKGETGHPKHIIYSWYQNPGKKEPRIFARTRQYKLYSTGEFIDVPNDFLEERPIEIESLDENTKKIYDQLKKEIETQDARRLDAIKGK